MQVSPLNNKASSDIKSMVTPEEVQQLRDDLNFYMKQYARLEREKHRLERILGMRLKRERKRFPERAAKLGRVRKDIYDFILAWPGLTTKEIQERWPQHKYHYKPTTFDNRIRELRASSLVVSVLEEDGLQHHYPNLQDSSAREE